ncbi:transposable element Tcb1 transposase [Trichonephila clavipes]|nr:transposable element Tcb1 transposase [Trichonephila clavipes]
MIFYVVELLDDWNVDAPSWKYPRNLESPKVSSPGFDNDPKMMLIYFQKKQTERSIRPVSSATGTTVSRQTMYRRLGHIGLYARLVCSLILARTLIWRAPGIRYHQKNTIERHRYGGAGWLVWGGIILGSRTDLHVQSVTMTGHNYRDVILEQHVRLFRGCPEC